MKTPVEFVTSEIISNALTGQANNEGAKRKSRPHIVASRAARQARRANH